MSQFGNIPLDPKLGSCYIYPMRIIARSTLKSFWVKRGNNDAEQPLKAWFQFAKRSDWSKPAEVKAAYSNASILEDNRVCFNIAGNKYRLIVKINYGYRMVYIRFVGTHAEYDQINPNEV